MEEGAKAVKDFTDLDVWRDLSYIDREAFGALNQRLQKIRRLINGLINSLSQIIND